MINERPLTSRTYSLCRLTSTFVSSAELHRPPPASYSTSPHMMAAACTVTETVTTPSLLGSQPNIMPLNVLQ
eukprot:g37214.t1